MFENTLLESSADRIPLLTSRHRVVAMTAGLGGFLAAQRVIPLFLPTASPRALLMQSLLVGGTMALHALMVCYVYGAAQRSRLRARGWAAATFLFSFAGFLAFLVHAALKTGDWKRATVPIAYILEAVLLGGLVIVPLIRTQALGLGELTRRWVVVPSPPPPRASRVSGRPDTPKAARPSVRTPLQLPLVIPSAIERFIDEEVITDPAPFVAVPGGVPWGGRDGVPYGIATGTQSALPPPPVRAAKQKPAQIRQGGIVVAARAIHQPRPDYPPLARMARIQGVVRLEAVISTDGTIQNLKLISGPPLLVPAALEAVARWRYQPTLLNGEPVEVLTEIDVNFHLAE